MAFALELTGMALGALVLISLVFMGLSTLLERLARVGEKEIGIADSGEPTSAVETPPVAAGVFQREAPPVVEPSRPKGAVEKVIPAPMPGTIVSIKVKVGDQVRAGDVLLTLESMKIQNEIKAPQDGKVKEIHVSEGAYVRRTDRLVTVVSRKTYPRATSPVVQGPPQVKPPVAEPTLPTVGAEKVVTCPMPGTIVSIKVKVGDRVKVGDVLLILESMKIQNEIKAPQDGEVREIHVTEGAYVR
ncbi:MAG: biotin/lipoyl-containing protein, partial [Dehalococcoidia bacterium]